MIDEHLIKTRCTHTFKIVVDVSFQMFSVFSISSMIYITVYVYPYGLCECVCLYTHIYMCVCVCVMCACFFSNTCMLGQLN